MKLIYNGGNRRLSRVVKRANEILLSSFYYIEIEKYLQQNYDEETSSIFIKELRSLNKRVSIKGFWNPIRREPLKSKNDYILINTAHLSKSHRTLLAQLIAEYLLILNQSEQLSRIIPFTDETNIPANFGSIAKNFM
ncbi:hypothetical protein [Zunongwangia pacifica]|uniref:Uncharacterized protein n=1 Tax=Zunongwangia pacifica TaxID=2911062 RepID=A0A9X1ZUA6_9FLAO|nr:hypothetical protein [Zunongwangia pacifica]MCL6218578.1 hypothetical protein [Zunongwangia pacifica]